MTVWLLEHARAAGAALWDMDLEEAYVRAVSSAVFGYGRLQPLFDIPTAVSPTGGGEAASGGRTTWPFSSIQMAMGTLVTPKRASIRWVRSMSDGWVEAAAVTKGRAMSAPHDRTSTQPTADPNAAGRI